MWRWRSCSTQPHSRTKSSVSEFGLLKIRAVDHSPSHRIRFILRCQRLHAASRQQACVVVKPAPTSLCGTCTSVGVPEYCTGTSQVSHLYLSRRPTCDPLALWDVRYLPSEWFYRRLFSAITRRTPSRTLVYGQQTLEHKPGAHKRVHVNRVVAWVGCWRSQRQIKSMSDSCGRWERVCQRQDAR